MQLSDIRTRVRYYLREATANVWSEVELAALITQAQRYIASRLNPELIPTLIKLKTHAFTGSTQSVSLESDYIDIVGTPFHILTADGTVTQVPMKNAKEFSVSSGYGTQHLMYQKEEGVISDGTILFSKALGAGAFGYFYVAYPGDFASTGAECDIPESYIDLVIIKAAADAFIKTRSLNESGLLMKELEARIEMANKEKK